MPDSPDQDSQQEKPASQKVLEAERRILAKHYDINKPEYSERLEYLNGRIAPQAVEACMPAGLAVRLAVKPDLAQPDGTTLPLAREQVMSMEIMKSLLETPIGNALADSAMRHDVLICMDQAQSESHGQYLVSVNAVTYRTTTGLPVYDIDPTVFEEEAHAWLANESGSLASVPGITHPVNQAVLLILGEASAKMDKAVGIMQKAENFGDAPLYFSSLIEGIERKDGQGLLFDPESDSEILKVARDVYTGHGLDEIYSNITLLRPVMLEFASNPAEIGNYEDDWIKSLENLRTKRVDAGQEFPRIPMETLAAKFGRVPGAIGNVFDGSDYQYSDEILKHLPPESKLRGWLQTNYPFVFQDGPGPGLQPFTTRPPGPGSQN